MGFDYALVYAIPSSFPMRPELMLTLTRHLKYTIPPAIILTALYRPFFGRIDLYKVGFLISVAVSATIPWDSYLIRKRIWTYPESVIIGPTLFSIPAEEVFFFFIQTYNTSFLYLLLSKTSFHPSNLGQNTSAQNIVRKTGTAILTACLLAGIVLTWKGGEGTYLGLILAWAAPVALSLWVLSSSFLVNLPLITSLAPIALPTLYLWVVDTLALRRGTWSIETGTKLGVHVWDGLEIEEAVFFLATNTLIVVGLIAFDHALTILLTFPHLFPVMPDLPHPALLMRALLTDTSQYDWGRVEGMKDAVKRLQKKSRSFYLASSTFSGRLRIDLILL
jgi:15-cis-phytoene synthase/lycopene beta-cyclase